ncbi:MAG: hypothetical protein ACREIV_02790, partial [Planctomycetaceae bacterium]
MLKRMRSTRSIGVPIGKCCREVDRLRESLAWDGVVVLCFPARCSIRQFPARHLMAEAGLFQFDVSRLQNERVKCMTVA